MCGGDGAFLHTVITGFSRVGVEGSGPFYQLRGSFGKGWGINGLIRLKKENDSLSRYRQASTARGSGFLQRF